MHTIELKREWFKNEVEFDVILKDLGIGLKEADHIVINGILEEDAEVICG